jgi:solute carrier family 35 protein E1
LAEERKTTKVGLLSRVRCAETGSDQSSGQEEQQSGTSASTFQRRKRQFKGADIALVRSKEAVKTGRRIPFKIPYAETLGLGSLFGSWYMFNVYFNVFNKRVLNAFPYPACCTLVHLGVGTLCMFVIWGLRVKKAPRLAQSTVLQVLPLGFLHLLGFLFTNASLGSVAVSFTHTIKALEPFFTAVFSAVILGSVPSLISMMALVPIVSGVILASFTEASFTWAGLITALGSNFSFQLRNVLSKQYMTTASYESSEGGGVPAEALDQMNLFACITVCACLLMFPCAYFLEGSGLIPVLQNQGFASVATKPAGQLALWSFLAGLCRFGDVLVSYAILSKVTPVTHSVGNCLKRVIVISASIFIFKNPVSSKNVIGTMLAITGVFLYSFTKRIDDGKIKGMRPMTVLVRKFARTVIRVFGLKKKAKPAVASGREAKTKDGDEEDGSEGKGNVEYYL